MGTIEEHTNAHSEHQKTYDTTPRFTRMDAGQMSIPIALVAPICVVPQHPRRLQRGRHDPNANDYNYNLRIIMMS